MNASKNYLKGDESYRSQLLESLGIKEKDLKRDVEIFRSWARLEKHLPQDFLDDDCFIERLLLNNKFRIEQSKIKYDNYFTIRTAYNSFFDGIEKVVPSSLSVVKFPLRKMNSEGKRILLVCATNRKNANIDLLECLKFQLAVSEIVNKYCFSDGRITIIDFKAIKSSSFKNFDVLTVHRHLKMIKSCYSGRISSLHLINMTNFGHILMNGIKMFLGADFSAKLKIHDSLESLYKEIPQECLPEDYGGYDISVSQYLEIWDDIIKEEGDFLKNLRNKTVDESLRIGSTHLNSDSFGVDGTFKKLNID